MWWMALVSGAHVVFMQPIKCDSAVSPEAGKGSYWGDRAGHPTLNRMVKVVVLYCL